MLKVMEDRYFDLITRRAEFHGLCPWVSTHNKRKSKNTLAEYIFSW